MDEPISAARPASRVNDKELLAAASQATNLRHLLRMLGLAAYGGNYESIRKRLDGLGGVPERYLPRLSRPGGGVRFVASDEELVAAAPTANTKADLLRALGYEADPKLYRALNVRLDEAGIDTRHFGNRGWSRGLTLPPRKHLEDLLQRGTRVRTNDLRRRLLREGVFEHRCMCCGLTEWQGRPIPLELDHIDGDRANNELGNLRLLCPNCHALTDTYRGRNIGRPHGAADLALAAAADGLRSIALRRLASIVSAA
jgi:hypothetical protein